MDMHPDQRPHEGQPMQQQAFNEGMQQHIPVQDIPQYQPVQDIPQYQPAQEIAQHQPAQDIPQHQPSQGEPQQYIVDQGMQQPVLGDSHDAQKHMDQPMDVDDSMNTTITASTVGPLPDFQATHNAYAQNNNGYAQEQHRPATSYSDTAYQYTNHNGSRFNTPSDADTPPRHGYYDASKETHMGQSHSRPNSQMGRYPVSEGGSRSNSYQDQNQRSAQPQQQQQPQQPEAASKNASVVIKVGMVGDAQIGKTSLMVKYVEGSWDEDYIQTLGMPDTRATIGLC